MNFQNVKKRNLPSLSEANAVLDEASKMNPGYWIDHSKTVALACKKIATNCELDAGKAYIMGLLHDIGRRVGICSERHMIEGYKFCMEHSWCEIAQICITHSFMVKDIRSSIGEWDVPEEEVVFAEKFINDAEYSDYDLLVQLCDSISLSNGCCLLEKRYMDVTRRYGICEYTIPRYEALLEIKKYFEDKVGYSIYNLLPNVVETTFDGPILKPPNSRFAEYTQREDLPLSNKKFNVFHSKKFEEQSHGGIGSLTKVRPFRSSDFITGIDFIDFVIVRPSMTIGSHTHGNNEEIYFIVKGNGTMIINSEPHRVIAGDVVINSFMDTHELINDSEEDIEIFVFQVSQQLHDIGGNLNV